MWDILANIGSGNVLSHVRHQAIAWGSADLLLTRPQKYIFLKFIAN